MVGELRERRPPFCRARTRDCRAVDSATRAGSILALALVLECDDVEVLKAVASACDCVLAAPHAAVERETAAATLHALAVAGLPPLFSSMGVVTLRGRTPAPMADLIIRRPPAAGAPA